MPCPCLSNFSYSELESGKEKNLSDLNNYASWNLQLVYESLLQLDYFYMLCHKYQKALKNKTCSSWIIFTESFLLQLLAPNNLKLGGYLYMISIHNSCCYKNKHYWHVCCQSRGHKSYNWFCVGTYLAWKKWERSNSEGKTASLCVLSQNFCWCLWKLLESLVLNF